MTHVDLLAARDQAVRWARAAGDLAQASDFQSMTGRGVHARVEGIPVAVGGPALLRQLELAEPEMLADRVGVWKQRGATVLYVVREEHPKKETQHLT